MVPAEAEFDELDAIDEKSGSDGERRDEGCSRNHDVDDDLFAENVLGLAGAGSCEVPVD